MSSKLALSLLSLLLDRRSHLLQKSLLRFRHRLHCICRAIRWSSIIERLGNATVGSVRDGCGVEPIDDIGHTFRWLTTWTATLRSAGGQRPCARLTRPDGLGEVY
jgi:hypothetical protein